MLSKAAMNVSDDQRRPLTIGKITALCIFAVVAVSLFLVAASLSGDAPRLYFWVSATLAVGSTVLAFSLVYASFPDRRFIPVVFSLAGIATGSVGSLVRDGHPLLSDILFVIAISLVLFFRFFRRLFMSKKNE
jgi:hypothetical protein